MTVGELATAFHRARNIFDAWNDVAGPFVKDSSSYYEALGVIEDAVHCGAQAAIGVHLPLNSEST